MGKNAIILVDKAPGVTSFDCLGRIKRSVNKKTGHCGTLDKFAHGLIIALCGSYTRLVPAFMGMDKVYVATLEFGKMTDTLDPEGQVIEKSEIPDFETIKKVVLSYVGPQNQVPPIYSAIHVNGKRSYQMARSGNLELDLKPRQIRINNAEILEWEPPFLKLRLDVSKGTYVRSYARDIGHMCASSAYVKELYRTNIGPFDVKDAVVFNDVEALQKLGSGENLLYKIPGVKEIELTKEEALKVSNGYIMSSVLRKMPRDSALIIMRCDSRVVCVYSMVEGRILCQVRDES